MSESSRSSDNQATSRRQAELDSRLRESIRNSGLEGKPLHLTSTPFIQSRESIVSGLLGPPAWAVRLRRIEDGRAQLQQRLEGVWAEYARRWRGKPEQFAERWRAYLAMVDLTALNTLIRKHNDWYPIEARLPIVWPTGEYNIPTGIKYPQQPVSCEEILEQYPADLDMALYFTHQE